MKLHLRFLILLIVLIGKTRLEAQNYFPENKEYNGNYYAIKSKPIKGRFGNKGSFITYNSKVMSGDKSVVLSICEQCMPTIYTYSESVSKKLGKAVFRNNVSKKMLIQYDKNSFFITTSSANGKNTVDFFCKNKAEANAMTKVKANKLWMELFSDK